MVKLHVAASDDEQECEDQGQVEGLRQLNQTIYMCTCKWTETNWFTICNEIMKKSNIIASICRWQYVWTKAKYLNINEQEYSI